MSVQIIIDSASDMTREDAAAQGLLFLPLTIHIDGQDYLDGVTITHEEFYEKLAKAEQTPKTSMVAPYDFEQCYRTALEAHDEVLVITISAKLSGTAQSATIAAHGAKNIWVVDSENVTVGERVLIDYAVRLRDQGFSAAQIAARLEQTKKRVCVIGVVETLAYLYKGGRLGKTSAIMGTMLNIKPVLGVRDGALVVIGKARGAKQRNNLLNEAIAANGGVDFSMPLMLAYSGTDDALLRSYIDASRDIWAADLTQLPVGTIGSTVGTHAGPRLIAVAFFAKEETGHV